MPSSAPAPTTLKVVFAVAGALSVAAISYSIFAVTQVQAAIGPFLTAFGVAAIAFLVLVGFVAREDFSKGPLTVTVGLLPRLSNWACATQRRCILLSGGLILVAAAALWLGPARIITVNVACGEASTVAFTVSGKREACKGAISLTLWIPPVTRLDKIEARCSNESDNTWSADVANNRSVVCGDRPQDANFVRNGIDRPKLDRTTVAGKRTSDGLVRLGGSLGALLPERNMVDRLMLATWNLRDFGRSARSEESDLYIAEILSHFDVTALQEISGTAAIEKVMRHLGPDYGLVLGQEAAGGCRVPQRLAFVFDKRKITVGRLSSSLVIQVKGDPDAPAVSESGLPCRAPFLAEFEMLGKRFDVVTFHTYFGGTTDSPQYQFRLAEIRDVFGFIKRTAERTSPSFPLIVAGTLQSRTAQSPEIAILANLGFRFDDSLQAAPTSTFGPWPYSQVAILDSSETVQYGIGGTFDFLAHVYRDEDFDSHKADMMAGSSQPVTVDRYRRWRSLQMSDQFPKWTEIRFYPPTVAD